MNSGSGWDEDAASPGLADGPLHARMVRSSTVRRHDGRRSGRLRAPQRRKQAPRFAHRPGLFEVLAKWFTSPHDFDWIFVHKSTRPLHGLVKGVVAGATAVYAIVLFLMMHSPNGPSGTLPRTIGWSILAIQVVAILRIALGPTPKRKWQFVLFLFFGDVGLATVVLLNVPTSGLIGTFLFSVTGSLCTFFLGPRWLVTHIAFANAVIVYIGVQAYLQDLWGPWDAVAAVLVALCATTGIPIFAQISWSLVSEDARRSALDPLTGTPNRRGLWNSVEDLWDLAHRDHATIAIVVVDIDQFKLVNDKYGHEQGDAVIILLARRLSELFRGHGILARTGGEEFIAVLVGEFDDLNVTLGRVSEHLYNRSDAVPVTASTGVALLSPDTEPWVSGPRALVHATRAADSLMYRAKRSGGNTVVAELL